MRHALAALLVAALALPAGAAEPLCLESLDACAVRTKAGEPALFDGQLLTPALAAIYVAKAEHCDDRVAAEVDVGERRLGLAYAMGSVETKAKDLEIERLRALLVEADAARVRAWYEEPAFVAGATAVLLVAAIVGTSYGVKKTQEP